VANNDLAALQQAWESANEGLDQTLLLNDLKRLITMANQELVLFGNVNSAVSILSSVDTMLQAQSAPALKNLQQAVIQDLARLRAVPQVDVASLSGRLDSLIQLTNKAPLLAPAGANNLQGSGDQKTSDSATGGAAAGTSESTTPSTTSTNGGTDHTAWWSSWDTATGQVSQWSSEASEVLMREFANLLSIRKADDPQALLLSEEQAIQLKANVRAMLLSAQLALMTRQAEIWRSELTEVQSLLNTRYDTDGLDTKASLQLLGELLQAPLAADVPQIAQTLNALASAERVVTIPSADPASKDLQSTGELTRESTEGSVTETATEPATESTTKSSTEPRAAPTGPTTASDNNGGSNEAVSTHVVSTEPPAPVDTTTDALSTQSAPSSPSMPSTPGTSSANNGQGS
jgi:uroporphyrin-3 C-methyltransferase